MATVTRDEALVALKKADWFGLSWGCHTADGRDQWCAAAWIMVWKYGPTEVFSDRGASPSGPRQDTLYFPREQYLAECYDVLAQIANWAEVLRFVSRNSYGWSVVDSYVFEQEKVTQRANQANDPVRQE